MSNEQTGTTPSQATRAEEVKEAGAAHVAGHGPNPDENAAAPDRPAPGVGEHYEEMRKLGASDPGEGRLP